MSVSRTMVILAILAVIVGAWFFATSAASQAAVTSRTEQPPDASEPIQLLKSDAAGITFAVQVAGLALEQDMVNGVMYDTVSAPGFGMSTKIGSPQVPTRRVLLGIPLGADYHLHISADQSETVPDRYRLRPAPTPILELSSESDPFLDTPVAAPGAAGWDYMEDARAYSRDALYPEAIVKVVSSGFIRDQRFIAVQVNPVQYNPVTGELVLRKQIIVEVSFTYPRGRDLGKSQSDSSFEPVLQAGLLNYESAANWRGKATDPVPTVSLATEIRDTTSPALKIMVDEDGIYQVTAADLEALKVPVSTIPTTAYRLFFRGREVPIRVLESEPGIFDSLWFYGEQAWTKYTDTNVYWLTYEPGPDPGLRMPFRDAAPVPITEVAISPYYSTTVRLEEDHWYRSYMPWAGDLDLDPWDHWFWNYTRYPLTDPEHPPNMAFPVNLSGLDTVLYSAKLNASLTGWAAQTRPDYGHCVEFYVNDQKVGSHAWTGKYREQLVSYPFSSSSLHEGSNAIEVHGCESDAFSDTVFYDWFELDIRRMYQAEDDWLVFGVAEEDWQYQLDGFTSNAVEVFNVSGTYTISQLAGYSVTVSEPYSISFYDNAAEQGTRYLALTRDQMKSPVEIVKDTPSDLANIANNADYIIITPKEFITDILPLAGHRAAHDLDVEVVELESVFDEFNYGVYSPEAIRDFLHYAYNSWSGDAPAYVLLVGDGTYDYKNNLDGNPKLFPPYLAWVDPWFGEEAADNRYVTVAGNDPFPDMHIGRFPAETSDHVQTMVDKTITYENNLTRQDWARRVLFVADNPDGAGNFHSLSDDLVNDYLPDPYVPVKAYYGDTCLTGAECKQVILDTLDTGALLVNYVGHGGLTTWTDN
ncbi:MAG: C25 family cysteine peptidase, partial [Anaerolineae bacterium]